MSEKCVRKSRVSSYLFRGGLALLIAAAVCGQALAQFEDNRRWTRTATDGFNSGQGNPTTLTWSFIRDGSATSGGTSGLIAFFDGLYGSGPGGSDLSQRPWFFIFEQPFERYSELSGLSFAYEPNDSGSFGRSGLLGTRGDIRFGGRSIDGESGSNTLAFASFPNGGDVTIDTDNVSFYASTSGNSLRSRNVVAHELGHSLGQQHLESSGSRFLMEPFISTSFDGPQLHDILALHREYGDVYEKSNGGSGNNSAGNATPLGTLALGIATRIGTDANDTVVAASDIDFISIDDNSDTDFLSFTLGSGALLDLTLTPMGPTYNAGEEGGAQSPLDSSSLSDLTLALFDTNGSSLMQSSNTGGLGDAESITGFEIDDPGTYFVRVTGSANNVQLYELSLLATALPAAETPDLNGDGFVGLEDLDLLLANWGGAAASPALGDANGDGTVDSDDLDIVINNWGEGAPPSNLIPEPGTLALLLVGGLAMRRRRRV